MIGNREVVLSHTGRWSRLGGRRKAGKEGKKKELRCIMYMNQLHTKESLYIANVYPKNWISDLVSCKAQTVKHNVCNPVECL